MFFIVRGLSAVWGLVFTFIYGDNGEGFTLAAYCMIALLLASLLVGLIGMPDTRGKSLEQITKILTKIHKAATPETDVYVLEPLWDKQRFEAAAYSLQATSLYFTCIANGNSKMYRYEELKKAIETAGFELKEAHHNIGPNAYSLLRFRKK